MSKYVKMAETHEIPKNKMKVFKVEDHEILVVNVEGELYAFENRCPHMGYPLYFGRLEGKVLTCGFHYAKFDVTSGKSLGSVTDKPLKKFKIKIQNSLVQVEL
ncbi:Rieske 2Fe-2S domain-containing protein [Candidatus Bathyarchaeota archaeon]|nr:Rieske 2Fe-2S domain-containing protein [Candidatus Bathyarchaeota archaeon]